MATCECGCRSTTGGGRYLPGHDAKHKSILIKEALAGNEEAISTLAAKGWTKFLDKKREVLARPVPEKRIIKNGSRASGDGRQPSEAGDQVIVMRAAGKILRHMDQYHKAREHHILIVAGNAMDIVAGTHGGLLHAVTEDMWAEFNRAEVSAIARQLDANPRFSTVEYEGLRRWLPCDRLDESTAATVA